MKTADRASPTVSAGMVLTSLIVFTLLYGVLAIVDLKLMVKYARIGPPTEAETSLLGAATFASVFLLRGAVSLALKTSGEMQERASAYARRIGAVTVVLAVAFIAWTQSAHGGLFSVTPGRWTIRCATSCAGHSSATGSTCCQQESIRGLASLPRAT